MRTPVILLMAVAVVTVMSTAALAQEQVTFTKDVAPILQNHCQVCHRDGTIAPMSLMTYEQARPWAKSIKAKVIAREMPPWFIDKNVGVQHFNNDSSLTDQEITTIVKKKQTTYAAANSICRIAWSSSGKSPLIRRRPIWKARHCQMRSP